MALDLAIRRQRKRVILLLLPGAPAGPIDELGVSRYLGTLRHLDFRDGLEEERPWADLYRAIKGVPPPRSKERRRPQVDFRQRLPIRRAVSVAIVRDNAVLLVRRARTQRTGAGLWQLPGGKVGEQEKPCSAAKREVQEEVGVELRRDSLEQITELAETWLDRETGEAMLMRLYWCSAPDTPYSVAPEFDDHKWLQLADLFIDSQVAFFGATTRMLRLLRRFLLLSRPLRHLADFLESTEDAHRTLPAALSGISRASTQQLYALLSLLGFLDDRSRFAPASIVSPSLIKTLAAWSLTEGQIFEPQGGDDWYREAVQAGARMEVERYRSAVFQEHESLLGLLSFRLSKALSRRRVCDVLLIGTGEESGEGYLLLRWDFFARKFQVPAKGLESLDDRRAAGQEPRFVVSERFDAKLVDAFAYQYCGELDTAHVSAGSLDDGPLMRKYEVVVYRLSPKPALAEEVLTALDAINQNTLVALSGSPVPDGNFRKNLKFYLWCSLEMLADSNVELMGRKLQGLKEVVEHLGEDVLVPSRDDLLIRPDSAYVPVVRDEGATAGGILQQILAQL